MSNVSQLPEMPLNYDNIFVNIHSSTLSILQNEENNSHITVAHLDLGLSPQSRTPPVFQSTKFTVKVCPEI